MRVFYSTTYVDYGHHAALISIGLLREDGTSYYAVNNAIPVAHVLADSWLLQHVWPHLPVRASRPDATGPDRLDRRHHDVKTRTRIATEVAEFLAPVPHLELWSWKAAHHHVLLSQLYGTARELPEVIPGWTNDLRQEAHRLGVHRRDLPARRTARRHALDDAHYNLILARCLDAAAVADPADAMAGHGLPQGW